MYIITENGKTWFNGTDIAISLKYENPQKAIRDHCKEHGITIRSGVIKNRHEEKWYSLQSNR